MKEKEFLPLPVFEELTGSVLSRAIGNNTRIKILYYLLSEPRNVTFLLESLNLHKTALSNHLTLLKESNLIEQSKKGYYTLSIIGYNFIKSFIMASSLNLVLTGKITFDSYYDIKSNFTYQKLESNFVQPIPKISENRLTFLGSISGLLNYLKVDLSLEEVGGYSGYAFRINVGKNSTHVSGPTGGPFWNEMYLGIEQITKRKLKIIFDPGAIFPYDRLSGEEEQRLEDLLNEIKIQINQNNPVILWGIHAPEFGIVFGYANNSIYTSTFKNIGKLNLELVHLEDLISPSGLWYFYFKEPLNLEFTRRELDKLALQRAVRFIKGSDFSNTDEAWELNDNLWTGKEIRFVTGLKAFDVWAENLLKEDDEHYNYEGNSYCGFCYSESLLLASKFLEKLTKRYESEVLSKSLNDATKYYKQAYNNMEEFSKLFPFDEEVIVTLEKKQKGSGLLIKCRKDINQALEYIEESIIKLN